jgi:hypothetical protein
LDESAAPKSGTATTQPIDSASEFQLRLQAECGSGDILVEPYDYGVCQETGYHDAGEMYACGDCGAAQLQSRFGRRYPPAAGCVEVSLLSVTFSASISRK